jgi:hypothetical protein
MVNVTANHQETMHEQIPKAAHHKATKLGLHKTKTQRSCPKRRVTKRCHNRLYLPRQAQVAINLTDKTQRALMKVAVMRAERIPTRIVRTEVADVDVNLLGTKK